MQYHVCRELLTLPDKYLGTHTNILPGSGKILSILCTQHFTVLGVNFLITLMSLYVFIKIFDSSGCQHSHHRHHGYLLTKSIDCWHPVEKDNEYEVNICKPCQLFKQI